MEALLTSADEKNMLARLQAHKEFVEHERAADARRLIDKFDQEKREMLRAATTGAEMIVEMHVAPLLDSLVSLARNAFPYVPPGRRQEFIDTLNLEEEPLRKLRATLNHVASAAPDLSTPFGGGSLLGALAGAAPAITFGGGLADLVMGTVSEHCKFGHAHPPSKIVAATENPTQPWGPRPYHCPDCSEVKKHGTVPAHWKEYPDPRSATLAGHDSACRICFPDTIDSREPKGK